MTIASAANTMQECATQVAKSGGHTSYGLELFSIQVSTVLKATAHVPLNYLYKDTLKQRKTDSFSLM
jgi:hypothetical protein